MILPPTYALRPIQNRRSHCTSDKCTFAKSPVCRVIRLRTATQKQKLRASPNLKEVTLVSASSVAATELPEVALFYAAG